MRAKMEQGKKRSKKSEEPVPITEEGAEKPFRYDYPQN